MWYSYVAFKWSNFEMASSNCFQEAKVCLILINMNTMSYHNHLSGYLSLKLHISNFDISYVAQMVKIELTRFCTFYETNVVLKSCLITFRTNTSYLTPFGSLELDLSTT